MIKLNNKAYLPYEVIGRVLDKYIEKQADLYTKSAKEYELFNYKRKEYKMIIEYKKNCINISVEEVNVLAKEVSMRDVKFPKIPKKKENINKMLLTHF